MSVGIFSVWMCCTEHLTTMLPRVHALGGYHMILPKSFGNHTVTRAREATLGPFY